MDALPIESFLSDLVILLDKIVLLIEWEGIVNGLQLPTEAGDTV
jgi:hypothetical protein